MKPITVVLVLLVCALSIALVIRGGEVLTTLAISTTNSSVVTVNITPGAPVCETPTCYDADDDTTDIDLVGGDVRYVKCNTTCNDENGKFNMKNFTGQMHTQGSADCTADNRDCYVNSTCENTTVAGNNTAFYVTCSYFFWYNADNTSKSGDWTGRIVAGDLDGLLSSIVADAIDVQELLAIGVDSVLAFGSKNADTNDSTVTTGHTLFNYGNIQMDFQVNGSTMFCDDGTISAEYLHVNLTSGDTYPAAYALTATLSGPGGKFGSFNLDENNTDTTQGPIATEKETYWGIGIPSGVNGNCQGTIWFAAVAS